jgi:hypothetical protein
VVPDDCDHPAKRKEGRKKESEKKRINVERMIYSTMQS